jgi:hypothetical protein
MNEVPKQVSEYMRDIGSKGGAAGKGKKKKRDAAHYQKMVAARKRNKAKRK